MLIRPLFNRQAFVISHHFYALGKAARCHIIFRNSPSPSKEWGKKGFEEKKDYYTGLSKVSPAEVGDGSVLNRDKKQREKFGYDSAEINSTIK